MTAIARRTARTRRGTPPALLSTAALPQRQGAMLVLIAFILPLLLIAVYYAVDTAYMALARTELRVAADAAARAGTEALLRTHSETGAIHAAQRFAAMHKVANQPFQIAAGDVTLGRASSQSSGRWIFAPQERPFNATRVRARRTKDSLAGPIRLFFANVSGVEFFEPVQIATAAQVDQDIAIVIEAGGSMHAPERWEGVGRALDEFMRSLAASGNRHSLCLIECHNDPVERISLSDKSTNLKEVLEEVRQVFEETKLRQARALGPGLEMASETLANHPNAGVIAAKRILFLGNGNNNQGIDPTEVARLAASRGQEIHVLTFGHNPDRQGAFAQSAQITGGSYHHVEDLNSLPKILEKIANTLSLVMIE